MWGKAGLLGKSRNGKKQEKEVLIEA